MSVTISFRIDKSQADALDAVVRELGVNRCAYLRDAVGNLLAQQPSLNIVRLNQVIEYNAAAIGILVEHIIGDKQPEIIAIVARRLEQFYGQR